MGDDTLFAVLSSRPCIIYDYFYDYFRQQGRAGHQPTDDPLREAYVMSLGYPHRPQNECVL